MHGQVVMSRSTLAESSDTKASKRAWWRSSGEKRAMRGPESIRHVCT